MVWRSIRLSRLRKRYFGQNTRFSLLQRSSSTYYGSNQSIASILALTPVIEQQEAVRLDVTGHVRTIRSQKRRSFVELGDGSTTQSLQALLKPEQAIGLGTGTAVTISGSWRQCPAGKEQSHELHAEEVKIVGVANPEYYPIQKKHHGAEYLRTVPHLRLRTPFNALLARLRSELDFYIATFFREHQFVRLQPPIITSSDCEGAGEVFVISPKETRKSLDIGKDGPLEPTEDYFRAPKYLTVSSQLHLEAFIHEHQRVWTLSPTFRAEKSDTPRHLSEFYMLEAEIRTDKMQDVMDLVEDLIRSVTVRLRDSSLGRELVSVEHTRESAQAHEISSRDEVISRRWHGLARRPWPRITYSGAMDLLDAAYINTPQDFRFRPSWHTGLQLDHEKFIAAEIGQGSPVFVTDYPEEVKPFYMLPSASTPATRPGSGPTVACFDLLLPEACEVVGGSLREHRLEPLMQSMQQHGLYSDHQNGNGTSTAGGSSNLDWYLDLRRYGSVPHGGFGLGFDRLLGYLAGVNNVRDVVPWPRYYGKCAC